MKYLQLNVFQIKFTSNPTSYGLSVFTYLLRNYLLKPIQKKIPFLYTCVCAHIFIFIVLIKLLSFFVYCTISIRYYNFFISFHLVFQKIIFLPTDIASSFYHNKVELGYANIKRNYLWRCEQLIRFLLANESIWLCVSLWHFSSISFANVFVY